MSEQIIAVIRHVNGGNAESLGYDPRAYAEGAWVIEDDRGEWTGDLPFEETEVEQAREAAERALGRSGRWRDLPANYGPAAELVAG